MFFLRLSFYLSVIGFFFPIRGRRYSHNFGKDTGEIGLLLESEPHRNFVQFHIRKFDILTGFLYFYGKFYPGYDYGDDGQAEDSYQITNGWVTVIYDGSVWRIASLLKFENYLSQKFNF